MRECLVLKTSQTRSTLNWLFGGGPEPSCQKTADADDDSKVILTDPVYDPATIGSSIV